MRKYYVIFLFAFFVSTSMGQSIGSETSNGGCEAGGEIWACGKAQVLQAHKDIDDNCQGFDYACGATIRTIVDVCSPNMSESRAYEHCD